MPSLKKANPSRRRQLLGAALALAMLLVSPTAVWADPENPEGEDSDIAEFMLDAEGDIGVEMASLEAPADDQDAPPEVEEEAEEPAPEPIDDDVAEESPEPDPTVVEDSAEEDASAEGEEEPEPEVAEREGDDAPPMTVLSNGVDTPYLEWTVADDHGQLVGGTSFNVQGPAVRTSGFLWASFGWGSTYTVQDCTGGDCSGYLDKDPAAGQFKVPALGGDDVRNDRRYRIRHDSAPGSYNFVENRDWHEIPGNEGSGNWGGVQQPAPTPNPFGDTWNFGAFEVSETLYAPKCEAGYSYGMSRNGYILQVNHANGSVETLGQSGGSGFNGLGISANGRAFAYTGGGGESITIQRYDPSTGAWSSTGKSINSDTESRKVNFVAGAVDLSDGTFYVGGYNSNGTQFRIWKYDPATNSTSFKGSVNTPYHSSEGTQRNGDMAFDDEGNLFIVRGTSSGSTGYARIFSIDASVLAAASGGTISSSPLSAFKTPGMTDVNGIAFDADGRLLLSNNKNVWSFEMPTFSNAQPITDSLYEGSGGSSRTSTDLATCASPPSITIKKFVEGGRVKASDQFTMTLRLGNQVIGAATTTGNVDGYQSEQVGPAPVVRGVALTFAETAAGSTNLDEYTTRYSCTVDGQNYPAASGSGTQGTITLPPGAQNAVCEFYNAPLVADIIVAKSMLNVDGSGPATPEEGWTVGLDLVSPLSGATQIPSAGQQVTNEDGVATWKVLFADKNQSTSINISEVMRQGFEFSDASCTLTHIDGSSSNPIALAGPQGTVDGVVPGDQLFCEFTNKPIKVDLHVNKTWVIAGEPFNHGEQPAWVDAQLQIDGDNAPWGAQAGPFASSQTVTIAELVTLDEAPAGCKISDEPATITPEGGSASGLVNGAAEVTLSEGSNAFTITNYVHCEQKLTLIKEVENSYDGKFSFGNTWLKEASDWNGELFAQDNPYNSGETKNVEIGEYRLTEGEIPGYVQDSLVCEGASLNESTLTIELGQEAVCTFTNALKPGGLTWAKTDGDAGLSGSEWSLSGPEGIEAVELTDTGDGIFSFEGLPWGEYTLTETKAPTGYKLLADPIVFTIDGENLAIDLEAINNEKRTVPDLPLTGGIGRDHVYIAGSVLALLGMAAYFATRRRRA